MKKLILFLSFALAVYSMSLFTSGCTKKSNPTGPSTAPTAVSTATPVATSHTSLTATRTATALTTATITATITATATVTMTPLIGQALVNLRTAANYVVLADTAISDIPVSNITGDVAISPGFRGSISGLTVPEVTGTIFAADDPGLIPGILTVAGTDAASAYTDATSSGRGTPTSISGDVNGLTFVPGLYESSSSIEISPGGFLYLDGQGDVNAVFIIRSATTITTSSTSEVKLTNGTQAKNVFWTAGSAVTLGTNSIMKGTIIASTSISLLTGANLEGRALVQGPAAAQVSMDQNIIVKP